MTANGKTVKGPPPPPHEASPADRRTRLESEADNVRSKLLDTIDAIDARRHHLVDTGMEVKRLAGPVSIVAASVTVGILVAASGVRALVLHRRRRRIGYRLAVIFARLQGRQRRPFLDEAARRAGLAIVSVAASEIARRLAHVAAARLDEPAPAP